MVPRCVLFEEHYLTFAILADPIPLHLNLSNYARLNTVMPDNVVVVLVADRLEQMPHVMISNPLPGDEIDRATGIEQCPRNDEVDILSIYGFTSHLEDSDAILFGLDQEKSAARFGGILGSDQRNIPSIFAHDRKSCASYQ